MIVIQILVLIIFLYFISSTWRLRYNDISTIRVRIWSGKFWNFSFGQKIKIRTRKMPITWLVSSCSNYFVYSIPHPLHLYQIEHLLFVGRKREDRNSERERGREKRKHLETCELWVVENTQIYNANNSKLYLFGPVVKLNRSVFRIVWNLHFFNFYLFGIKKLKKWTKWTKLFHDRLQSIPSFSWVPTFALFWDGSLSHSTFHNENTIFH